MQFKEYTDNDIAIQFEGTNDDGTAPDQSLIGKPNKKNLMNNKIKQLTLKEFDERKKNDSIFL